MEPAGWRNIGLHWIRLTSKLACKATEPLYSRKIQKKSVQIVHLFIAFSYFSLKLALKGQKKRNPKRFLFYKAKHIGASLLE